MSRSNDLSPVQDGIRLKSGVPTREELDETRELLLRWNQRNDGDLKQMLDKLKDLFRDISPQMRRAMKHVMFQTLAEITDDHVHPIDVFLTGQVLDRAEQHLKAQDGVRDNGNGSDVEIVEVRETVDSRTAREQRAYTSLGWVSGDGSDRDQARVFAGVEILLSIKEPIGISKKTDYFQTITFRPRFEEYLETVRWKEESSSASSMWVRLHPWSVDILSNFFFVDLTGMGFFAYVERVVAAYDRRTPIPDGRGPDVVDDYLKEHPGVTEAIKAVVGPLLLAKEYATSTNLYHKHVTLVAEVKAVASYYELVEDVESTESNDHRHFLELYYQQPLSKPLSLSVALCFQKMLAMTAAQWKDLLDRVKVAVVFYRAYGTGVLMFVNLKTWASLGKCAGDALPTIVEAFNRDVPEVIQTCFEIPPRTGLRWDPQNTWSQRVHAMIKDSS